jgi:hypothetical protein
VEAILRRAAEKAEGVRALGRFGPEVSKLLVIRSTVRTREIVIRFHATIEAAYPASAPAAHRALADDRAGWPGPAVLWSEVIGDAARILDRAPRGTMPAR